MGDTLSQRLPVAFSLKSKSPSRWIWPVELSVFRTNSIISSTYSYKEKDSQLEGQVVWIQFNSMEKRCGRRICHKPDRILIFWNVGWNPPTCLIWGRIRRQEKEASVYIDQQVVRENFHESYLEFSLTFIVVVAAARSQNQMFLRLWNPCLTGNYLFFVLMTKKLVLYF